MQLGVLEYLISINNKGVSAGMKSSESLIKRSAEKAERGLRDYGNKVSAWTIAKGQMIAKFAEKAISTVGNIAKQTTKSIINAYGEFEQLEGGAKLLWGKSFDFIEKRAKTAYKNVQMSASEYMRKANNYAVGLKTSLGGDEEAAAKLADRIITAQADIVAALGKDASEVENAFNGIMKGNYTMLDNLGLGIKGSQQGMKDLIKQVNEWNKANGKATKYQMGNIADMQSALLDFIEMQGLSGYAEKEGSDTLQGSIASAKAAWQNVLVEAGKGNWDFKYYVKTFTTVAKDVFKNIKPVAKNAIKGLFTIAKELLPEVGSLLRDVFSTAKVTLAEILGLGDDATWGEITKGVIEKLKSGAQKVKIGIATFLDVENPGEASWAGIAKKILTNISNQFGEGGLLGELLSEGATIVGEVANFAAELVKGIAVWVKDNPDKLSEIFKNIATAVTSAAGSIADAIVEIISNPDVQDAIMEIVATLIGAIYKVFTEGPDFLKVLIGGKVASKGIGIYSRFKDLFGEKSTPTTPETTSQPTPKKTTKATKVDTTAPKPSNFVPFNVTTGATGALGNASLYAMNPGLSAIGEGALGFGNLTLTGAVGGTAILAGIIAWGTKTVRDINEKAAKEREVENDPYRFSNIGGPMGDKRLILQDTVRRLFATTGETEGIMSVPNQLKWMSRNLNKNIMEAFAYTNTSGQSRNKLVDMLGMDTQNAAAAYQMLKWAGFDRPGSDWSKEWAAAYESGKAALAQVKDSGGELGYEWALSTVRDFFEKSGTFNKEGKWTIPGLEEGQIQVTPTLTDNAAEQVQSDLNGMNLSVPVTPLVTTTGNIHEDIMNAFGFGANHNAKGNWNVPYDNFPALLHRDEMVLTKSQARRYKDGDGMDTGAIVSAIQGLRNDMANLKLVVGRKVFGRAVADYGSSRVSDNIGGAESRLAAGYGT